MANFAWVVNIFAKLSMRDAAVHANWHATHAQHYNAKAKRDAENGEGRHFSVLLIWSGHADL
jgi:hypothetical protein